LTPALVFPSNAPRKELQMRETPETPAEPVEEPAPDEDASESDDDAAEGEETPA
jgi:hypothetical protein